MINLDMINDTSVAEKLEATDQYEKSYFNDSLDKAENHFDAPSIEDIVPSRDFSEGVINLDAPIEEPSNSYYCPLEGSNGHWEGERGNSQWCPDPDYQPQKHNPEDKTWGKVMNEHDIDNIPFKEGEPDFSEVSKGEVVLDERETDRSIVFNEADTKLAEERACTPAEVRTWRKENGYTWHEKNDGLTVQKVPSIVHGNVAHAGGHSSNLRNLYQ